MRRRTGGGPSGDMPRSSQCLPLRACGARPSPGGYPSEDGLAGEGPEIARRAVFSEGCALRVRVGRPYVCRGITYSWEANEARWPRGHMPRSSASVPSGRAEPAPPRGGQARVGWANGENPEITRGAIFSEGRGLRARKCRPRGSRGMDLCTSTQHFSRPGVRP